MAEIKIFSDEIEQSMKSMLEKLGREIFQEIKEKETGTSEYLIPTEFCKYVGISFATYRLWVTKYQLPTVRVEGKVFVSKKSFHEWMKQHEEIFYEK